MKALKLTPLRERLQRNRKLNMEWVNDNSATRKDCSRKR